MMTHVAIIYLIGAIQFALIIRNGVRTRLASKLLLFIHLTFGNALVATGVSLVLGPQGRHAPIGPLASDGLLGRGEGQ